MYDMRDAPLGYLLYRILAALRPAVTAELRPLGLTLPGFVCLRSLSATPGRSSADLARDASISPQSMNYVLISLQDMGAVERPATVSSGRARPARLTNEGKVLLKKAESAVRRAEDAVLANLATEERHELKRLLNAVDATGYQSH
jgi:DNA-binding MarR family transcriptional regulator